MSCAECLKSVPKRHFLCGDCRRVQYCSKQCGIANWNAHKTRCVGDTQDFKKPAAAAVVDRLLKELGEGLRSVPKLTAQEIETIQQSIREKDIFQQMLAVQLMADQHREMHVHQLLIDFIQQYLTERANVPAAIVQKILETLIKAEREIFNATFEFIDGKTVTHLEEAQKLTNLATTLAEQSASFPEKRTAAAAEDTPKDSVDVTLDIAFEISAFMQKMRRPLAKDDDFVRSLGYIPNALFEGTDAEVQSRIDRGELEKPDWWDTRYQFIDDTANKLIGMRTLKPKKDAKKEQEPQVPYPRAGLPSDIRARAAIGGETTYSLKAMFGYFPKKVKELLNYIVTTGGPEPLHWIIDFGLIVSILMGVSGIFYKYGEYDYEAIYNLEDAAANATEQMVKYNVTFKEYQEKMTKWTEEWELLRSKNTNVTFSLLDVQRHMYGEAFPGELNWLANATDSSALAQGYKMTLEWLNITMKHFDPSVKHQVATLMGLQAFQEALLDPTLTPLETEAQLRELFRNYQMFFQKVNTEDVSIFEDVTQITAKVVAASRNLKEMKEYSRKVLETVERTEERVKKVLVTTSPVLDQAKFAADNLDPFDKAIRSITNDKATQALLFMLKGVLGTSAILGHATFDRRAAEKFMQESLGTATFFQFLVNSPDKYSRTGMFCISNSFLFQWIVTLLEQLEETDFYKFECLKKFDDYNNMTSAEQQANPGARVDPWQFDIIFKRILRTILHRSKSLRYAIRLAPFFGLIFAWASYTYYTGCYGFGWRRINVSESVMLATNYALAVYQEGGWKIAGTVISSIFSGTLTSLHIISAGRYAWGALTHAWGTFTDFAQSSRKYETLQKTAKRIAEKQKKQQQGPSNYWRIIVITQAALLFLYLWMNLFSPYKGSISGFNQTKSLNNKAHWPQYKTREDTRRQRVLVLE